MPIERHFLGWDQPAIPSAADWMINHRGSGTAAPPGPLDFGHVMVVVPGARAGRLLLQRLARQAHHGLVPPTIVTVGSLPERLYKTVLVAGEPVATLVRVTALAAADRAIISTLTAHPPPAGDCMGHLELARELTEISEDLGREAIEVQAVASQVDDRRWDAIVSLERTYQQVLDQLGLIDRTVARRRALEERICATDMEVVLLAVVDLPGITAAMLEQLVTPVTALIFADPQEAAGFGPLGQLCPDAWVDRPLSLQPAQVVTADRPLDQARSALEWIDAMSQQTDLAASQITVGLGDSTLGEPVCRCLNLAGVPVHLATGKPLRSTRPALVLEAASQFLESSQFEDFASLLRHPDLPLTEAQGLDLAALDDYATERLPGLVTGNWLGSQAQQMVSLHEIVMALLPPAGERRALAQWAEPLAAFLRAVYSPLVGEVDEPLLESLEAIGDMLEQIMALDTVSAVSPTVTAAGAIGWLLELLADQSVAEESQTEAVEVLGFLELVLDDAPRALIVGVNEGSIPTSRPAHPLLPNSLRRQLGLIDDRGRFARDLYFMIAITCSRPGTVLVTGRRSGANDPLLPSRLLLACPPREMARRLGAFYDPVLENVAPPLLVSPGNQSFTDLRLIPPQLSAKPINKLSVTAFRDYIQDPYRFNLRYVVGLNPGVFDAVEMTGSQFGRLAHRVLCEFGHSELADSDDASRIISYLRDRLAYAVRDHFGQCYRVAVTLQLQQLDERLVGFAHWQADANRCGWRIVPDQIERSHHMSLDVDGEPFDIYGQIDRIDRHPEHGWRIVDYKTRDDGELPDTQHRRAGDWVDLQLPLYHELARATGIEGPIELGYLLLPRKLSAVGFAAANWSNDQIESALQVACQVVRGIRADHYWPPADPPFYLDGLGGLCYDHVYDRGDLVARSDPPEHR